MMMSAASALALGRLQVRLSASPTSPLASQALRRLYTQKSLVNSHCRCGPLLSSGSRGIKTTSRLYQYIPSFNSTGKSRAFVPINPATLPKPPSPPPPSSSRTSRTPRRRLRKTLNTFLVLSALSLVTYILDTNFNYSALTRSLRTFRIALTITLDYKLNFTSHKSQDQLSQLHARNADRVVELCLKNGGLYQKIGQAIAMQSALLPTEFQAKFARFFSDTPQAGKKEIERVLKEEFPHLKDPANELFVPGTFTGRAMGSASVAQVHKAQLNDGTGEWVAVKIQKPGISRQVGWDLGVFKLVMGVFSERMFGLPLGFVVPYICERLESETDFNVEKGNSMRMRKLVEEQLDKGRIPGSQGEGRVYVPRVYENLCTKRVLVAEWIDGVSLSQGRRGGFEKLDISSKVVMNSLIQLFSRQMYWWGEVHCDPHPGNIIIRKIPASSNSFDHPILPARKNEKTITEVVLLDHGLYIHLKPTLRQQYARLWTALMSLDTVTVTEITNEWGFGNAEMVASMTMLRPYQGSIGVDIDLVGPGGAAEVGGGVSRSEEVKRELTPYERQVRMKEAMRLALANEEKVPRELVFLGRCMRILQANNQLLSSPVNRLNLLAYSASASLLPGNPNYFPIVSSSSQSIIANKKRSWLNNLAKSYLHHMVFRLTLFILDLGFWFTRVRAWALRVVGARKGQAVGFEDEIEERMRRVAKEEWGLEIGGGVFRG